MPADPDPETGLPVAEVQVPVVEEAPGEEQRRGEIPPSKRAVMMSVEDTREVMGMQPAEFEEWLLGTGSLGHPNNTCEGRSLLHEVVDASRSDLLRVLLPYQPKVGWAWGQGCCCLPVRGGVCCEMVV